MVRGDRMKTIAILAAAGRGERLGGKRAKLWVEVRGKPLIYYSINCVARAASVDGILLMSPEKDISSLRDSIRAWGVKKIRDVLAGGELRQDTVRLGIEALPKSCGVVVIHDAARPMASAALFERVIEAAIRVGAASAAIQPVDTIARIGHKKSIEYLDRNTLRIIQTPQAFRVEVIRDAHKRAIEEGFEGTDDAGLALRAGHSVELVEGDPGNFKVTYSEDIKRLTQLIEK